MAKRPNLATLPSKTAETRDEAVQATEEPTKTAKRFPNKVQATLYLDKPVHKALKLLAVEHETSVHSLVMEGIDMVLQQYGSKPIAQLTTTK